MEYNLIFFLQIDCYILWNVISFELIAKMFDPTLIEGHWTSKFKESQINLRLSHLTNASLDAIVRTQSI